MFLLYLFYLALLCIIGSIVFRACFSKVILHDYEAGLFYRTGRFQGLLPPGLHWILKYRSRILVVDTRRKVETVPGQEVLTSDNVGLRISVSLIYQVEDPVKAKHEVTSETEYLYSSVQTALRSIVGSQEIEKLLEERVEIGKQLMDEVAPKAKAIGLRIHEARIKDAMLPADVRKAFAETVKARKEGMAALERARGETAALRHLANAAKMLDKNPALMNLRLLQSLGQSAEGRGNTLVLGMPQGLVPLEGSTARTTRDKKTGPA